MLYIKKVQLLLRQQGERAAAALSIPAMMDAREEMIKKKIRILEEIIGEETKIRTQKERERLKHQFRNEQYTTIFEPITKTLKSLAGVQYQKREDEPDLMDEPNPDLMDEPNLMDLTTLEPTAVSLYKTALDSIPRKLRDDGIFGLDWKHHKIGNYYFYVLGNTLFAEKHDVKRAFNINDINVWKLLLEQRPNRRELDEGAIEKYRVIARTLDLVPDAQHSGVQYWNRIKYKLLEEEESESESGSGLQFAPSTMVIPSDRKGLLRDLAVTLAEYQAGNVGLRRRAKALIKEARRRKFLPKDFFPPGQLTWHV